MILPPNSGVRFPVRIIKETQPAQPTQTNKPNETQTTQTTNLKETQTTKPTRPVMTRLKEELPSMDEILTKLGMGKDRDPSLRRRFRGYRYDAVNHFTKTNNIDEKSLQDWSKEECRNNLRKMSNYFLLVKGGSSFWPDPPHNKSRYIFSRDSRIILGLLMKYFCLFISSSRRKSHKPRIRKRFLQGHGDSADTAIEIDDLSDDGGPAVIQESSANRVPKREPIPQVPPYEDNMVPQQQTSSPQSSLSPPSSLPDTIFMPSSRSLSPSNPTTAMEPLPKQSNKRLAETELPQAQTRAKSICRDRDSAVGLRDDDEDSLFLGDDEPIYNQLMGRSLRRTRQTDYTREDVCFGASSNDAEASSKRADSAVSLGRGPQRMRRQSTEQSAATNTEPAIHKPLEKKNAEMTKKNPRNTLPKDSVPGRQNSARGEIVCKPLQKHPPTPSPCEDSSLIPESEPATTQRARVDLLKEARTAAVLHFESGLDSPMHNVPGHNVSGQTYLPPVVQDTPLASESTTIDLTLGGISDDFSPSSFSTKTPPAIKDINPLIPTNNGARDMTARPRPDKIKEVSCPKIPDNAQLNKNPYQSIFKVAPTPKKKLHFDSEHAKKVLDNHLRDHAKSTTTPIKFSFAVRHSASHADRFNFCPFTFFTISLRELVAALPMEDKDQITGLCIRQYGVITSLRQVYLYNEEVFGNIREEFIRYIESDIRNAKCTGKRLDYEISIEPIMDD